MTVSSPICSDVYVATGTDSVFPYTWQLLQAADLIVAVTDLAGTRTVLTLTTDYTISAVGSPLGGNVTLVAGNLSAGYTLGLFRAPGILQLLLLQQGAAFNPADLMRSLDLLTMICQWLQNQVDRAIVVPPGSDPIVLPDPEALALLQWRSDLTGLQNLPLSDLATILVAGNYIVDRPAFTPGVTTALTLTQAPGTVNNAAVFFDGVYQQKPTYTVSGVTLTLTSPVPLGVASVEVVQAGVLPINTPADNSVSTATMQNLSVTGDKVAEATLDLSAKAIPGSLTADILAANVLQAGKNAIINGSARVGQRVDYAANLTGVYGYGKGDRCKGALTGGTSVAGTLTQVTNSLAGISGYAFRWSAVTLVGTSCTVKYRFFIEAKDALRFKNGTATFSAKMYHNIGSAVNFTITVSKATVADNFAAVTTIQAGSAQSVANATDTLLYLRAVAMGDCSTGIQIDIVAATGAIAGKSLDLTDVQFELSDTETAIEMRPYGMELALCQRYYEALLGTSIGNSILAVGQAITTSEARFAIACQTKRIGPVTTVTNPTNLQVTDAAWTPVAVTVATVFDGFAGPTMVVVSFSVAATPLVAGNASTLKSSVSNTRINMEADF